MKHVFPKLRKPHTPGQLFESETVQINTSKYKSTFGRTKKTSIEKVLKISGIPLKKNQENPTKLQKNLFDQQTRDITKQLTN